MWARPERSLGADAVLATGLEVGPDGALTGRYDGKNCRGEEKLRRLRAWIGEEEPAGRLWAYGNSRGDLRMLSAADVGVNVGRLGRLRAAPPIRRIGRRALRSALRPEDIGAPGRKYQSPVETVC